MTNIKLTATHLGMLCAVMLLLRSEAVFGAAALRTDSSNQSSFEIGTTSLLPPAFFSRAKSDDEGKSNEVLVRFKPSLIHNILNIDGAKRSCADLVACEHELIADINSGRVTALRQSMNQPTGARYLMAERRLNSQDRAALLDTDPLSSLQSTIILRFSSVNGAKVAVEQLATHPSVENVFVDVALSYSSGWTWTGTVNDPSFQPAYAGQLGQWGMTNMNFPAAWVKTPGGAYLGAVEAGYLRNSELAWANCSNGVYTVQSFHCDLADNIRDQFHVDTGAGSPGQLRSVHTAHVLGIMGARGDNGLGQSGGCPWCSLAVGRTGPSGSPFGATTTGYGAAALIGLVDRGIQAVNVSANLTFFDSQSPYSLTSVCGSPSAYAQISTFCAALAYAATRDVNVVVSAGNRYWTHLATASGNGSTDSGIMSPQFPASEPSVIAVGAVGATGALWNQSNWLQSGPPLFPYGGVNFESSSSSVAGGGVVAPGVNIISTMPYVGAAYSSVYYGKCGDAPDYDASGYYYDGYGTCTGTSMAAPHVTALVGLVRSINPLLTYSQVKSIVLTSGNLGQDTWDMGWGLPNALTAVNAAIATNPSRLTPLFAFYSEPRNDYFYTVVPQMGRAAIDGTLRPGLEWAMSPYWGGYQPVGTAIPGYSAFPGATGTGQPLAQAWVFSTPTNPITPALALNPLIRLSATCADRGGVASICSSKPAHIDVTYVTDSLEIAPLLQAGYKIDGIEGFVYPKSMAQPSGAVRLLRRYNPARDDTAIFPETPVIAATMAAQGYTTLSGADWIGYVYANNGTQPVVAETSVLTNYVTNGSFESPNYPAWWYPFSSWAPMPGWTGSPYSIAINNANKSNWTTIDAPDGTQVLALTMADTATTTVNLSNAGAYVLKFKAAKMNGACCGYLQTIDVRLDGASVTSVTPSSLNYSQYQITLNIGSPGAHTITFAGTTMAGGVVAAIDDVRLTRQ
jgi:serine protease